MMTMVAWLWPCAQLLAAFDQEMRKDIKNRKESSIAALSTSILRRARSEGNLLAAMREDRTETETGKKTKAKTKAKVKAKTRAKEKAKTTAKTKPKTKMKQRSKSTRAKGKAHNNDNDNASDDDDAPEGEDLVYQLTLKAYRHLGKLKACLGHELFQPSAPQRSSSSASSSSSSKTGTDECVHPLDLRSMRRELERCLGLLHPSSALPFHLPSTSLIAARATYLASSGWAPPPPPLPPRKATEHHRPPGGETTPSRRHIQTLL
jgi:hypothetical protein